MPAAAGRRVGAARVGRVQLHVASCCACRPEAPARAAPQDQASKDTRSAASSGRPDDDSASPLTPALSRLPPRARGGLLTAVWAVGTIGVSSTSYIATRTSGNLADCANEHGINTILTVRAPYVRIGLYENRRPYPDLAL